MQHEVLMQNKDDPCHRKIQHEQPSKHSNPSTSKVQAYTPSLSEVCVKYKCYKNSFVGKSGKKTITNALFSLTTNLNNNAIK